MPSPHLDPVHADECDAVQAAGILNDFEPRTEWVYDEADLDQARHFASGHLDFRAVLFHRLHRRVDVLDRKAHVVDDAAFAGCWLVVPFEKSRASHRTSACPWRIPAHAAI